MESNYWSRYWRDRRSSRRRFLGSAGALGAGAAGFALVGCGDDDDDDNGNGDSSPAAGGDQTATGGQAGTTPSPTPASGFTRGGTHIAVWETEPSGSLDPHLMKSGFVAPIAQAIFDGFLRTDPDDPSGRIGMLAEDWEQPDEATFTFKLREGVKFHDGTDYDAEIAKWNAERILQPGMVMEGGYTGAASRIDAIEVVDTHSIKFTFSEPSVDAIEAFLFDSGIGITGAVSRQAAEAAGGDFWQNPVGTGPYKFRQWDFGSQIVLDPNPDYYEMIDSEKLPFVDEFRQIALPDIAIRAVNVRSGEVSSTKIEPEQVKDVESDDVYIVQGGPEQLIFYPNHTQGVFANPHLRRALAYAIDRKALADTVFFGQAEPGGYIPKSSKWYDPEFEGFTYDPDKAKEEMAAGGMPDGFEFECMVLPTGVRPKAVEFMQALLQPIGIKVNIAPTESATYVDRLMVRGEGDCFFALTGTLGLTETGGFEPNALPNPGRKQNPDDPRMQELVAQIESTFDEEERKQLIHEAQRYYFMDLVAIIPVLDAFRPHAVRSEWTGFQMLAPNFLYPDYRQVRLKA